MKRFAVVILALGAFAAPARALVHETAFAAGLAVPVGPAALTDSWKTGFALGAEFRVRPRPQVAVGLEVAYARFGFDAGATGGQVSGNDLFWIPMRLRADVDLRRWGTTKPYVQFAAGYCAVRNITATFATPNAPRPRLQSDAFTLAAGAGVRTALGPRAALALEAGLDLVFADTTLRALPIRVVVVF